MNKNVVLYALDKEDNTFNLVVIEPKFKQTKRREVYRAPQVKIKLD